MRPAPLSVSSFATAGALLCGANCFLHAFLGFVGIRILWYNPFTLGIVMTMFPGAGPTPTGIALAAAWGAFTGALIMGAFSLLHNWAQRAFKFR